MPHRLERWAAFFFCLFITFDPRRDEWANFESECPKRNKSHFNFPAKKYIKTAYTFPRSPTRTPPMPHAPCPTCPTPVSLALYCSALHVILFSSELHLRIPSKCKAKWKQKEKYTKYKQRCRRQQKVIEFALKSYALQPADFSLLSRWLFHCRWGFFSSRDSSAWQLGPLAASQVSAICIIKYIFIYFVLYRSDNFVIMSLACAISATTTAINRFWFYIL